MQTSIGNAWAGAFGLACVVLGDGATAQAGAAAKFPERPIRLMVPYAPGGNTDILARTVGQRLLTKALLVGVRNTAVTDGVVLEDRKSVV